MAGNINKVTRFESLLLLLLFVSSAFQCEQEKEPEFVPITLSIPFTITPLSSTVFLGDTIWVTANFSEVFSEYKTTDEYVIKNFDFKSKVGLFKFINSNIIMGDQPSATDFFTFVPVTSTVPFIGETFSPFTFVYDNNQYKFKLGLVPKQRGVYCINFLPPGDIQGNFEAALDLGVNNMGQKRIPVLEYVLFVINDGNTNFDLFQKHCRATSTTFPGNQDFTNINYEQKGSFTFEVK